VPSGILIIAIAIVWAVVLIPMWLKKHDEANQSRSVDRFSRAMGSLSSRRAGRKVEDPAEPRSVVMPQRPRDAYEPTIEVKSQRPAVPLTAAGRAAGRRRRVLISLLAMTLLVLPAALLHKIPRWSVAIPILLAVVFVVSSRRQVARAAEMARRRRQRGELTTAAKAAQQVYAGAPAVRRGSRSVMRGPIASTSSVALESPAVVAYVEELAAGFWHAVPTTLPTYVTAPAATSVPRIIDLKTPGKWSGAAMLEQARSTRHEEPTETSGMRVETFEIALPATAGPTYGEVYVDTAAGSAELNATDDEAFLEALLEDPRTGVSPDLQRYGRAAG
jgi:hypothetical protein